MPSKPRFLNGFEPENIKTCDHCGGDGVIKKKEKQFSNPKDAMNNMEICPKCHGLGIIEKKK